MEYFSNVAKVLIALHDDPQARLDDMAREIGITARAVQRIVRDLEISGAISSERIGRRKAYQFRMHTLIGDPQGFSVGAFLAGVDTARAVAETPV